MTNLPNLEPGKRLTSAEIKAISKDNEKASNEAKQQAYEQNEADMRAGRVKPVVNVVAEGLKKRLEEEDFSKK